MNDETANARVGLAAAIDAIEAGYEFLLAYAAQGRKTDRDAGAGQGPRDRLASMVEALTALPGLVRSAASEAGAPADSEAFFEAFEADAAKSAAAIRLVLAQEHIGSQLVDNLNASIHLRALLTDLFLIDEVFKPDA